MARRNLGTINLDEPAPVTYKGDFPEQISDEELLRGLEQASWRGSRIPAAADESTGRVEDISSRPSVDGVSVQADPQSRGPVYSESVKRPSKIAAENDPERTGRLSETEIKDLLGQLDSAQNEQKSRKNGERGTALAIMLGNTFLRNAGIQVADPHLPEKYDVAKGKAEQIQLGDKMRNTTEHWEDRDLIRALNDKINQNNNQTKRDNVVVQEHGKDQRLDQTQDYDASKTNKLEGGRDRRTAANNAGAMERTKVAGAFGIGRTALTANASAGNVGARADAEYGNRQAERQVAGLRNLGPHTSGDETKAAHLFGAYSAVDAVGRKAVEIMRKEGPNFPQSTAWQKLESTMVGLHEDMNKLHEEGVMNYGDKANREAETGDPQSFKNWVMANGPDLLEHALDTARTSTSARLRPLKYDIDPNAKLRNPSEFTHGAAGGSARVGVDPNSAGAIGKWAAEGGQGQFPQINNPSDDVKTAIPQQPQKKKAMTYKDFLK